MDRDGSSKAFLVKKKQSWTNLESFSCWNLNADKRMGGYHHSDELCSETENMVGDTNIQICDETVAKSLMTLCSLAKMLQKAEFENDESGAHIVA